MQAVFLEEVGPLAVVVAELFRLGWQLLEDVIADLGFMAV